MARPSLTIFFQRHFGQAILVASSFIVFAFWLFGAQKDFWFSEEFVRLVSSFSLIDIFTALRFENNPPFLFLLAHGWRQLVGDSESALRLLSLAPSVGTLWIFQPLVRRWSDGRTALLATIFLALSGLFVYQSIELRMYPWILFWTTLTLLAVDHLEENITKKWIMVFLTATTLGLLTHYTFVVVFILSSQRLVSKKKLLGLRISLSPLPLVAFWYVFSFMPIIREHSSTLGVQLVSAPWWNLFRFPFEALVPGVPFEPVLIVWTRIFLASIASILIFHGFRTKIGKQRMIFVWFLLGLALLTLAKLTSAKYATVLLPFLVFLVSTGLANIKGWRGGIIIFCLAASLFVFDFGIARQPFVTYREATSVVTKNYREGDLVMVHPFNDQISVQHYLGSTTTAIGFFPGREPGTITFDNVVRYNFTSVIKAENVHTLEQYVGDRKRVWFFYDVPLDRGYWNGALIDSWFNNHGFRSTTFSGIFRNTAPLLVLYQRESIQ